ncbi:MAG: glycosyltransferase family protein [Methanobacteriaceae archaeon]|nr:glycosyltransferase family protein [Methanobacteriaceae archaeon]
MKMSIIIPTYNEEEYLPKLLESIKMQDFTDYEIIVADANSKDNTREIAEKYGAKVVDGGLPGVGRNAGAKVAKGDLLLFLDSDLELTPNYINNVIEEFEEKDLGIAITQMTPLSEKKKDKILHDLANWFMISVENIKPHGAGCYGMISKRSLHEKCGGFDESIDFGEDTDYIERLAELEEFKVLRNAKVGVSTRRLEEEGLYTLLKQYGKSTYNDFRGKRTSAKELNYGFDHENSKNNENKGNLNNNSEITTNSKITTKSEITTNSKNNERKIIFYSVCGEGMGHAIRSGTILEELTKKHDVYIFSSERAYQYLDSKFDNVYEIGGFNTVYENNTVNNTKTFLKALKANPTNLKEGYNVLYKMAKEIKPNIMISDFENYSSMVSNLLKIPLISVDNIHMLAETDYEYPENHKIDMLTAKAVARAYILRPVRYIMTSFFYPPLKHPEKSAIYPPVLRKEILDLEGKEGKHILVYQTSASSINLMEELKEIDEEFILYGFDKDEKDKNLTFRKFNEDQIYEDMASAKAMIVNGGFTMISEAIHLKKPIYSTPAKKNFEQILNGFYVEKLGYGEMHENLNGNNIKGFLNNLDTYKNNLEKIEKTDNTSILKDIEESIQKYSKDY